MQAEKRILTGLFWCMVGCAALSLFFEFHLDYGIYHPAFLTGHRDYAINFFLGGLASSIVSYVMTLLPYWNKKEDLKDELYPHIKKLRETIETYYQSIKENDYEMLVKSMEMFEKSMTEMLDCYYQCGVKICEYSRMERFYCKNIIGYSTHIMNFDIVIQEKTDARIKKLFLNIEGGITKSVYEKFICILDKWIEKYEKRFRKQPSDEDVFLNIKRELTEYEKVK